MSDQEVVQDLSFPVKLYVGIVHLLLLFLVVLFLQKPRKNGDKDTQKGRKSRTFTKDNRAVTLESCEWINSTLAWFFLHAQSNKDKDRTPHIVKLWIRALNKQLQKDKKKGQRIVIESLSPGCLPPKLTSVYCLCVSGNMQCITFHVESADLGFLVAVLHQTADGPKTTYLETRVVKLTGEVALKMSTAPSRLEVSVQFIGVPEIAMATKFLAKDREVDGAEVQEKVKEVICKTITNVPLTADATSRERLSSDAGSATSKERLDSPSSISCIGEEGKLLVKVIKASGLNGKDKTGPISPYCIVSTSNPLQRKRTSMVRDNDNPFWNEYLTFDITPKTKEISLDVYNFEKTDKDCNGHMDDTEVTEEQDDYLGQVIVPLSTVNRDQTCRLILPILPKSSKSEHSKGDISLEFTFDKDGKVIDATLPLVSGLERNVLSSDPEKPSAQSTPSEESHLVHMNGAESGVVNGHIPVRKRYIESSLDELAMEIEAYEHGDEKPKPNGYHDDTHTEEPYEEPELHREAASSPVVVATEVAGPSREAEQKEDESERTIVELLKMSGEEAPEESKDEKSETAEDERKEKQDEGEEEKEHKGQVDEQQIEKEQEEKVEEKVEEPSLKPKHRRSINFFKRKKSDKKAAKDEKKVEEKHKPEEEPQEGEKKEETPVQDKEEIKEEIKETPVEDKVEIKKEIKETPVEDKEEIKEEVKEEIKEEVKETPAEDKKEEDVHTQEATEDEQKAKEDEEKIEQASELQTKPKPRFKFLKRRPHSMAAADVKMDEGDKEKTLSRHTPVRHSYHAGDLPVPDTSNIRRSTSQSSLLSYSPNPNSTLVIETVSKGEKKYSHIPHLMAKRRAYEKGGNKLHIYNDHVFMAVHFSGSSPDCTVCSKPIKGKIGKQGYQCRGCKIVTHRDCHCETTTMCTSDEVKQMDIKKMPQFVGHK